MLSPDDLDAAERFAKQDLKGNLGQQAAARRTLRLVEEVKRCWALVKAPPRIGPVPLRARPTRPLDAIGIDAASGKGKASIE